MNLDDFTQATTSFSMKHKKYPIHIWIDSVESIKLYSWAYAYSSEESGKIRFKNISELYRRHPEEVSDELFNLVLLKYSML